MSSNLEHLSPLAEYEFRRRRNSRDLFFKLFGAGEIGKFLKSSHLKKQRSGYQRNLFEGLYSGI